MKLKACLGNLAIFCLKIKKKVKMAEDVVGGIVVALACIKHA